jgi:hypothetical protein
MTAYRSSGLVVILMESPLYMTLSLNERKSLISRLLESYPFLTECNDDEMEMGYEASWQAIFQEH